MSKRTVGIIAIVIGVVVLVVSLIADQLGIGGVPGIGWKQTLGAVVGALIVIAGVWWGWNKPKAKK